MEEREEWEGAVTQALADVDAGVPLLFFGDTNLDPRSPSERSLSVALTALGLVNLNQDLAPTHRKRCLDYAFSRGHIDATYQTAPPVERKLGHSCLLINVSVPSLGRQRLYRGGSYQWRLARWDEGINLAQYTKDGDPHPFSSRIDPYDPLGGTGLPELQAQLTSAVQSIVEQVVPRSRRYTVRPGSPIWYNASLVSLGDRVRWAWEALSRARAGEDGSAESAHALSLAATHYKRTRNKRTGVIKAAKGRWARSVIEHSMDANEPWGAVRRLSGKRQTLGPLRLSEGRWAVTDSSKAEALALAFAENFTPATDFSLGCALPSRTPPHSVTSSTLSQEPARLQSPWPERHCNASTKTPTDSHSPNHD